MEWRSVTNIVVFLDGVVARNGKKNKGAGVKSGWGVVVAVAS